MGIVQWWEEGGTAIDMLCKSVDFDTQIKH
jgi:hypothetical protein